MTAPRDWPNKAVAARDRTAETAVAGIRALRPLINGAQLSNEDIIRRAAQTSLHLQQIARMMESVGAKSTDPTSEEF